MWMLPSGSTTMVVSIVCMIALLPVTLIIPQLWCRRIDASAPIAILPEPSQAIAPHHRHDHRARERFEQLPGQPVAWREVPIVDQVVLHARRAPTMTLESGRARALVQDQAARGRLL